MDIDNLLIGLSGVGVGVALIDLGFLDVVFLVASTCSFFFLFFVLLLCVIVVALPLLFWSRIHHVFVVVVVVYGRAKKERKNLKGFLKKICLKHGWST